MGAALARLPIGCTASARARWALPDSISPRKGKRHIVSINAPDRCHNSPRGCFRVLGRERGNVWQVSCFMESQLLWQSEPVCSAINRYNEKLRCGFKSDPRLSNRSNPGRSLLRVATLAKRPDATGPLPSVTRPRAHRGRQPPRLGGGPQPAAKASAAEAIAGSKLDDAELPSPKGFIKQRKTRSG